MENIIISKENINSKDAKELINELSNELCYITGNSGRDSFDNSDVTKLRSVFVVAREEETAIGCGAFREMACDTAEIKRMYVRTKSRGIGKKILIYLEQLAKEYGYSKIMLETRKCNENAVNFYISNGYKEAQSYGKYKNICDAICFEKIL
jgi:ribosomal protein S18 acetylase RimI-like enzyme